MAQHILITAEERPDVFEIAKQILIPATTINRTRDLIILGKKMRPIHTLSSEYLEPGDAMVFTIAPFDFSNELGEYCKSISVKVHLDKDCKINKFYAVA